MARAGLKLAYTPVLLGLALLTYAGVRYSSVGCSGFSRGIVISNCVAAGCAQGNHAARKSHELHPSTTTVHWVDDFAQQTQALPSEVVNKTVEAALQLVRDLQEDKLAVASKSVSVRPHGTSPNRLFLLLQDMTYTSRKPAKPRIWGWMCPAQESQCVGPWPNMGQGEKTNEKVCEGWQADLEASQCTAMENGSLGAESLWYSGCGCAADVEQAGAKEGC